MGKGAGARWILAGTVGLLAFVGVGASAAHYLQEPYNPGFLDFPTVLALHGVLGGVCLALVPFQFVGRSARATSVTRQRRQENRWRRIETWLAVVALVLSRIINRVR